MSQLESLVKFINELTNSPLEPYTKQADGTYKPNAGCYHLDQAYGGYRLVKMAKTGTGTADVSPRLSKRELYDWIHAYKDGILSVIP